MTRERHAAAVAAGDRILLVARAGRAAVAGTARTSELPAVSEILIEGIAAVDRTDPLRPYAAIRTDEGEVQSGPSWPSESHMHVSLAHYRVHDAVVYRDVAASAAAIQALDPKPAAARVWEALEDCSNYSIDRVAVMRALGHQEYPAVIASERARAEREAAEEAEAARRNAERNARLDAMTAVAVGDATIEEARRIRAAISAALDDHDADGTPRRIDATRAKGLIRLTRGTDPAAVELHVPLGNDRHAKLGKAVRVRWQESPYESDVSGVFHCARAARTPPLRGINPGDSSRWFLPRSTPHSRGSPGPGAASRLQIQNRATDATPPNRGSTRPHAARGSCRRQRDHRGDTTAPPAERFTYRRAAAPTRWSGDQRQVPKEDSSNETAATPEDHSTPQRSRTRNSAASTKMTRTLNAGIDPPSACTRLKTPVHPASAAMNREGIPRRGRNPAAEQTPAVPPPGRESTRKVHRPLKPRTRGSTGGGVPTDPELRDHPANGGINHE